MRKDENVKMLLFLLQQTSVVSHPIAIGYEEFFF